MRILVCNDDGVYSPGIAALAAVAKRFGEVRIVAPDVEQSSMSHAITASRPLHVRRASVAGFDAWRVDGTPADCVAVGMHTWGRVDLVVSGINIGLNLGNATWHSGTLAAAKQAALLGARGIAFSAPANEAGIDYRVLQPFAERILERLLEEPDLCLVNVNFPERPRGIRWTRQSVRHYDGRVVRDEDPLGREHWWFVPVPLEPAEEGTDRWAVEHGCASVTPLRLDLTDETALRRRTGESRRWDRREAVERPSIA